MPKKHSPSFVQSETALYAVNRSAKRLALRQGIQFRYVGLQPLKAYHGVTGHQTIYERDQDGQIVPFTPYYEVKS